MTTNAGLYTNVNNLNLQDALASPTFTYLLSSFRNFVLFMVVLKRERKNKMRHKSMSRIRFNLLKQQRTELFLNITKYSSQKFLVYTEISLYIQKTVSRVYSSQTIPCLPLVIVSLYLINSQTIKGHSYGSHMT